MIPSVGRIVHYVLPVHHKSAGQHRAAIIVALVGGPGVSPGEMVIGPSGRKCRAGELTQVDLTVFGNRDEPFSWRELNVSQDRMAQICGTFHQPERFELADMPDQPREALHA